MARSAVVGAASMKPGENDQATADNFHVRPSGSEGTGGNGEANADDRAHRERPPQKVAQVIRMRRQMQRERKAVLAELRPLALLDGSGTPSESSQWLKESGRTELDYAAQVEAEQEADTAQVATEEDTATKVLRPVSQPGATTTSLLSKVDRAHKGLVRKEVWRQKFDFLYKLVAEEVREDKKHRTDSSIANAATTNASSANTASTSAFGNALGRVRQEFFLERLSSSMFSRFAAAMQFTEDPAFTSSRPSSASHSVVGKTGRTPGGMARSRSASLCSRACSAPAVSQAGSRDRTGSNNYGTAFDVNASRGDDSRQSWRDSSPCSHNIRGGWCTTGSSRPSNSRSRRRPADGHSRASKKLCSDTLPHILSGSASLPLFSYKASQSQQIWSGSASFLRLGANRATMEEQDPHEGKGNHYGVSVQMTPGGSSDSPDKIDLIVYTAVKKKTVICASVFHLDLQPSTGKRVTVYDERAQCWALQFSTRDEAAALTTILEEAKVSEQLARELCGIRDEYYRGNERFMHEDILYSSNPEVFPLCTNPDVFPLRPFPLRASPAGRDVMRDLSYSVEAF